MFEVIEPPCGYEGIQVHILVVHDLKTCIIQSQNNYNTQLYIHVYTSCHNHGDTQKFYGVQIRVNHMGHLKELKLHIAIHINRVYTTPLS